VRDEDLNMGRLFPPIPDIRDVSLQIAVKIMETAYANGKFN